MQITHIIGMLIAVQIIGLLALAIAKRLNAEKARATGYDEGYDSVARARDLMTQLQDMDRRRVATLPTAETTEQEKAA